MKGLGLTPLFGDRRGFMPPQLKTNKTNATCFHFENVSFFKDFDKVRKNLITF